MIKSNIFKGTQYLLNNLFSILFPETTNSITLRQICRVEKGICAWSKLICWSDKMQISKAIKFCFRFRDFSSRAHSKMKRKAFEYQTTWQYSLNLIYREKKTFRPKERFCLQNTNFEKSFALIQTRDKKFLLLYLKLDDLA